MVTGIYIAVILHHTGMATLRRHGTYPRLHSRPVGKRGVKQLYVVFAYILLDPFVEQGAQEVAPLLWSNRKRREIAAFAYRCQPVALLQTLHNRGKLYIMTPEILEKVVELKRIIGIVVIDDSHGVPFHTVFLEQTYTFHHIQERGTSSAVAPVLVVKLLGTVDRDAHQPVVVAQKTAPLVIEQRTVCLQTVHDLTSAGIFLLQFHSPLIE